MIIKDTHNLGSAIRQHRKSLGLSQLNAAGLCGVGERFLSELERGKPTAELGKVLQVLSRLGLRLVLEDQ
jgi:y4mF family transcriptional regulator